VTEIKLVFYKNLLTKEDDLSRPAYLLLSQTHPSNTTIIVRGSDHYVRKYADRIRVMMQEDGWEATHE
jgi:hypothetical protein